MSAILAATLLSGTATAHVDYMTESGDPGSIADLFGAIVSSPASLALLVIGAGRYSLDATVLLAIRKRINPLAEPPASAGAD